MKQSQTLFVPHLMAVKITAIFAINTMASAILILSNHGSIEPIIIATTSSAVEALMRYLCFTQSLSYTNDFAYNVW